jgi:hypothetical protein
MISLRMQPLMTTPIVPRVTATTTQTVAVVKIAKRELQPML